MDTIDPGTDAAELQRHELSKAWPDMKPDEFIRLVDSIKDGGLQEDIVLYDGQILDGWHRYTACIHAGAEPRFRQLPTDTDPVRFVINANTHRRHLTPAQRAKATLAAFDCYQKVGRPAKGADAVKGDELAGLAGVSKSTIDRAKRGKGGECPPKAPKARPKLEPDDEPDVPGDTVPGRVYSRVQEENTELRAKVESLEERIAVMEEGQSGSEKGESEVIKTLNTRIQVLTAEKRKEQNLKNIALRKLQDAGIK